MMGRRKNAFTLAELLVVLAIIGILSAILFPIFASAKAAAIKTSCAVRFRQVELATFSYISDYDDVYPIVQYNPGAAPNPITDRTWVQLLIPYTKNFTIFECPGDYGRRRGANFPEDPEVGTVDTDSKYYTASFRVNTGYNFLYLAPMTVVGGQVVSTPRSYSQVSESARSFTFIDSVYQRTANGAAFGGGSFVVVPPCRFARIGQRIIDSFALPANAVPFSPVRGWVLSNPNSPYRYGLAWPWHRDRATVGRISGGTKAVLVKELSDGCDVRENWAGFINDSSKYDWDNLN